MPKQTKTPKTGTNGTSGVLNARGAFGSFLRSTNTPMHTNMNANKVPMLVISPTTLPGTKAANKLTNTMKNKLERAGVRNRLCSYEKTEGNNPSWLME